MVAQVNIQALREYAPAPGKRVNGAPLEPQAVTEDQLDLSPEARQAAVIAKLAADLADSEVRREKVEEAKRNIQEGAYRVVNIVNLVAARISGIAEA